MADSPYRENPTVVQHQALAETAGAVSVVEVVDFVLPGFALVVADHGPSGGQVPRIAVVIGHHEGSVGEADSVTMALPVHVGQLPEAVPGLSAVARVRQKDRLVIGVAGRIDQWPLGHHGSVIADDGDELSRGHGRDHGLVAVASQKADLGVESCRSAPGAAAVGGAVNVFRIDHVGSGLDGQDQSVIGKPAERSRDASLALGRVSDL